MFHRLRTIAAALVGTTALVAGLAVLAGPAAAQPPQHVFENNDRTWGCSGDDGAALPPHHCINKRSRGVTGIILVFPPDDRGPAEGVSDARADDRPCPHDPDSPDGTWWETPTGVFVCHHRP